jgi:DNA-binding IclR family transcriptional regulator
MEYGGQSIRRAAFLLERLAAQGDQPLGKLAQSAELHASTARRLLVTLESLGYVYQDQATRSYRLGPKLMYLGRQAADQVPFRALIMEEISALARDAGETVYVAVLHGGEVLYVETAKSPHSVRLSTDAGDYAPAYSTATGHVLLAHQPAAVVDRYLAQDFPAETARTVTDREDIRRAILAAGEQGYSIAVDQREVGVVGVAVPILWRDGVPQAALAIAGPTYRIPPARRIELAKLALASAAQINSVVQSAPAGSGAMSGGVVALREAQ